MNDRLTSLARKVIRLGTPSLRLGLGFKLVLMTSAAVLLVTAVTHIYYQTELSEVFIEGQHTRLESTVRFLKAYGKTRFQATTINREDLRLLLEPFLVDSDLRFIEIRTASGEIVFREIRHPIYNGWVESWKPPATAREQSGRLNIGGEAVVYIQVPFFGPKERSVANEILNIESLFGAIDEAPTASVEDDGSEELKAWVMIGTSADEAIASLFHLRISSLRYALPVTALALILIYFALRWTVQPVIRMSQIAGDISRGNFDDRVQLESADEIGELADAFNRMTETLSTLFGQVRLATYLLSDVASKVWTSAENVQEGSLRQSTAIEETSASIEEMNRSIREITQSIQYLEQSAEESTASILEMSTTIKQVDEHMEYLGQGIEGTVANVSELSDLIEQVQLGIQSLQQASEETASSMHQVDANIRNIKDATQAATGLAESVVDDARKGRAAVERTAEGIREIRRFADNMEQVVGSLEDTSGSIVRIVSVIREISDQTNLLALNAAIIAAQAGERGKGFSVIAQEIKRLSDRTAEKITEIAELIDQVRSESRRAAEAMRQSREAVEAGTARAEEAGGALQAILGSTEDMMERVRAIEQATSEQSRGSHQVAVSSQQVAEMVSQLVQNTSAQAGQAAALREAAQRMQNIAQQVRRTTREQSAGSQLITSSIERITEMVKQIARSLGEQQQGSDRVLQSTDQIRDTAETNLKHVAQLTEVVRVLHDEVERFQRLFRAFQSEEQA